MAYRVRILPSAEEEIDEAIGYLAMRSKHAARSLADRIRRQAQLISSGIVDYGLSKHPRLAALGYHSCIVGSYVMLYFYESDEVVIAHLFHQRMDYAGIVTTPVGKNAEE